MSTRLPSLGRPDPTTAAPSAAPPLSLEERLTLVNAAMTARLDEAAIAYEVNTAHIETKPIDLTDVVTGPLNTGPAPLPDLYPTPVAALLQRAHQRLVSGGWCKDALVDADGARCMLGAIRIEAGGDRHLEADAATVLLDAIRRQFGDDVDSVPGFNDAWGTGRVPMRMLEQAASLADARGL
ncbi:hypothetical protein AQJ43_37265 [Streptomyces avermitilis]|uniref:Uncharacterized protein n=2 Tax=Streptomyces avermitilis TaxID=33903 RepID=Q825E0_STRAW|nr:MULTISPECIES: hypothetical protein [Streptomyces]KUN47274.1 hypothetical protein AQJ43_37265 [Streptomyces avermitilis]MYT03053.1 hypothetical protein [Streptomyces sp. SID5469]BAC75229.1 hypothetical protein SAVERM_7518 [Streptomyces avermitilis MA-4680 = NBRC 14893]BAU77643.1 hypothetical protein SAVERM_2p200 [Streptomyces avermitilis MA-4680 = NBRC 14893]GDY70312.1 hypothetical protein SAV14893_097050 [Streptomyces avermitilis]